MRAAKTALAEAAALVTNPFTYKTLPYDPEDDSLEILATVKAEEERYWHDNPGVLRKIAL